MNLQLENRTALVTGSTKGIGFAIARLLARSGTTDRIFELAGPTAYTLRDLAMFTLGLIGRARPLIPVPLSVAEGLARLFEVLPNPPLTTGQVDLRRADNLANGTLPGFRELDIHPKTIEAVVPTYIGRSRAAQVD